MPVTKEPPPVTLRPITNEEYDPWLHASIASYAADLGPARKLDPAAAKAHTREQYSQLLPDRQHTTDQLIWTACHQGQPVGNLWVSTRSPTGSPNAFVFGILVAEAHRGRGFGRAIMLAGEQECRRLGLPQLELNVFGANTAARGLYESLGYQVVALQMNKAL